MADPFRCAASAQIALFVCIFAIADHSFVYAWSKDAHESGASVFHAKGCKRSIASLASAGTGRPIWVVSASVAGRLKLRLSLA
jgi:hypothetical protein